MSFVRKVRDTQFGHWLRRLARVPGARFLVRSGVRLVKRAEQETLRWIPKNRAHDRTQQAALAAFEHATDDRQPTGANGTEA